MGPMVAIVRRTRAETEVMGTSGRAIVESREIDLAAEAEVRGTDRARESECAGIEVRWQEMDEAEARWGAGGTDLLPEEVVGEKGARREEVQGIAEALRGEEVRESLYSDTEVRRGKRTVATSGGVRRDAVVCPRRLLHLRKGMRGTIVRLLPLHLLRKDDTDTTARLRPRVHVLTHLHVVMTVQQSLLTSRVGANVVRAPRHLLLRRVRVTATTVPRRGALPPA